MTSQTWRRATAALTVALIILGIAWETVLAPLRPGAWLLAFKVIPLVLALPALLRGHVRDYQLWSMLMLLYLCEGVVRGMSDAGLSATLGWIEALLAGGAFGTIIAYVRAARAIRSEA
jgi:uncharacterized membrane protein